MLYSHAYCLYVMWIGDCIQSFTIAFLFISLLADHTHTLVEASCRTTKCLSPSILHTLCGAVPCLCIFSIIKPPQLESYLSVICVFTFTREQTHKVKPDLKNIQTTETSLTKNLPVGGLGFSPNGLVSWCGSGPGWACVFHQSRWNWAPASADPGLTSPPQDLKGKPGEP